MKRASRKFSRHQPEAGAGNPEDLQIPQCLETADEAIAVVGDLYGKWQEREGR